MLLGPYKNRVTNQRQCKHQVDLNQRKGSHLSDLIDYAGGFKENAYSKSVKITRIFDDKLKIVDVNSDQFEFFTPKAW